MRTAHVDQATEMDPRQGALQWYITGRRCLSPLVVAAAAAPSCQVGSCRRAGASLVCCLSVSGPQWRSRPENRRALDRKS